MTEFVETIRCEIVKPLDGDWDDLGRTLRALRAPLHRVMNRTITSMELAQAAGDKTHPRTASYRLVSQHWRMEREEAAARLKYTGDDAIGEIGPGSKVVLGVAGVVYARWAKWDKERWKGTSTLPTFGNDQALAITGQGVSIAPSDGLPVLSIALRAGRNASTRLVLRPLGNRYFGQMAWLLQNTSALCDACVVYDGKWQVMLKVRRTAAEAPSGGRVMALHRGMRSFLTFAIARSADGKSAESQILETGEDIARHKAAHAARRRSLGQQYRQLGKGAHGHGKARRKEHATRLEDAEARWVRSKCQEVAAHALGLAQRRGVSTILVEDWSNPAKDGAPELGEHVERLVRQWPFAALLECITWGAKRRGIEVVVVPSENNSRTCPACGHVNESSVGTWRCSACELERNREVIACWNMLRKHGCGGGVVADANKATKKAAARLRSGVKKGAAKAR